MQIDTPNKTYSPVKPDGVPVTPPAVVKPVKDEKQERSAPGKPGKPGRLPKPEEVDGAPSFDDYA